MPLHGPDGKPLQLQGTVEILFDLEGTPCRHKFTVCQGSPLLLLGNDFLSPRQASITYSGDGQGHMTLRSRTRKGVVTHQAEVTTEPVLPRNPTVCVVDLQTMSTGASETTTEVTSDTGAPQVEPLPEPKPLAKPNELIETALQAGRWELQESEHLLYTREPIRLPARSLVTVRLPAPKELIDKSPTCLVDRLPTRDGLEDAPRVLTRCTTIEEGYLAVQIVNLRRVAYTLAAHMPIAKLESEFQVWHESSELTASQAGDDDTGGTDPQEKDEYTRLPPEQKAIVEQVKIDPDGILTADQLRQARNLVARYVKVFAQNPQNPGKTHLLEVELNLKPGSAPHRHAPGRLGDVGNEIIEKHVAEMEANTGLSASRILPGALESS
mmetsp:Transcript_31110/g.53227  ORF Transcript_31110/g.53227 Transcript_31110/m.53227 type:complete len:382 (-) Transcript_31110:1689-2834(-)